MRLNRNDRTQGCFGNRVDANRGRWAHQGSQSVDGDAAGQVRHQRDCFISAF
ncbi:hypothetical protein Psta_1490 [Pirellula staleyi DSM 6068]|uniref:Uncharacterized protein n=1 Tax=Pirellula staleyi (strain ATCC 27377 / DSM 6068 / ICPB 4128) TaxID=530564 RepID=D2QXI0_PIRSD|nr:hypothetical protein Psta_1490 [Pirellula staleyi DSM 6068]